MGAGRQLTALCSALIAARQPGPQVVLLDPTGCWPPTTCQPLAFGPAQTHMQVEPLTRADREGRGRRAQLLQRSEESEIIMKRSAYAGECCVL